MSNTPYTPCRHRRQLLKLAGIAASIAVNPLALAFDQPPAPLIAQGKLYRTDLKGRLFVSEDGGLSWLKAVGLGPDIRLLQVEEAGQGWVRIQVINRRRHSFWLRSNNDRTWLMDEFRPIEA